MMPDNPDTPLVFADLPDRTDWTFGGLAYGLEPLTMPPPGAPDALGPTGVEDAYGEAGLLISISSKDPTAHVARDDEVLYWFRWITGHQVSFITWRLIGQLLADAEAGRLTVPAALAGLCTHLRTYTAMLLYTGSCTQDVYQDVIRPSMRLRHPGFSGAWAPDYWPIRDLLRGRRLPFALSSGFTQLLDTVTVQRLVHDGVAAKLVPDGRSLLRQSGAHELDLKLLHVIYDNYFLTLRAPVSRRDVVAQLIRRLVAIARDVEANGLNPAQGDRAELPEELRMSEVVAVEHDFIDILSETANWAVAPRPGLFPAAARGGPRPAEPDLDELTRRHPVATGAS